jgi:hypothetical protein
MGPIEIALRNAPYRKTEFIFEPLLGLTFDSDKEAYEFYNMYSWEVGFGIKYGSSPNNNKRGYHTGRDLRCLCSVSYFFDKDLFSLIYVKELRYLINIGNWRDC